MRRSDPLVRVLPSFMNDTMRGSTRIFSLLALILFVCLLMWYSARSSRGTVNNHPTVKVSKLLHSGIALLNAAGEAVVEHRHAKDQDKQVKGMTKEGKKEFVTLADLKSHVIIKDSMMEHFPGLEIISEEHDPADHDFKPTYFQRQITKDLLDATVANGDTAYPLSDVVVWIDPLDATQEYTEMLDQYVTIMMCIVVRGEPLASVLHFPFSKTTYWQWADHRGSNSLNSVLSKRSKLTGDVRRVVVSRSHAGEVNATLLSIDQHLQVTPAGGAGYKAFQLIQNSADAYVHTTAIKKWDICVGDAMLRHTGGELRSLKTGERLRYGDRNDYKVDGGFIAVGKQGSGDELLTSLQKKLQKRTS
ncbi:inositol monophosphatase 3-like [Sycon ciliatum]|uniref:inositol monophosphatase 3-like n=1 Tax=Sycon ciliatum TaxID=27933 RepID=UPI0020AB9665